MYNFDLGKRKYSTGKTRKETGMRVPRDFTFHFLYLEGHSITAMGKKKKSFFSS